MNRFRGLIPFSKLSSRGRFSLLLEPFAVGLIIAFMPVESVPLCSARNLGKVTRLLPSGIVLHEGASIDQQGVAYAQTIAGAMNLKLDMDSPRDREKLRRAILDLVAGRKMPKQKGRG
jgi:hypothetical protein